MSTSTMTHDDSTMPMAKAGTQRRVGLFGAAPAAEPATPPVDAGAAEAATWDELTSAPPASGGSPAVGGFAGMPYLGGPPAAVGEHPGRPAAPGQFAGPRAPDELAEDLPVAVADLDPGSGADAAWPGLDTPDPVEQPAVEAVEPAPAAAHVASARRPPRPLKKVLILTAVVLAGTALLVAAIYLGLRTRPAQQTSVSNPPPVAAQTDPVPLPPYAEPGAVPPGTQSGAVPPPSVGASGLPPAPDMGADASLPPDVASAPLPPDPAAGASPTGPVPPDAALTNPVPGASPAGAPAPGTTPAGDPFAAEPPPGAEPAPSFTGGDFSAPDRSFTDPYSTRPARRPEPGIRPRGYPHRAGPDRYPSGTDRLNRPLDSLGATGGDDGRRPHRQPLDDAVSGLGGLGGR
jgi:hypothetical protein